LVTARVCQAATASKTLRKASHDGGACKGSHHGGDIIRSPVCSVSKVKHQLGGDAARFPSPESNLHMRSRSRRCNQVSRFRRAGSGRRENIPPTSGPFQAMAATVRLLDFPLPDDQSGRMTGFRWVFVGKLFTLEGPSITTPGGHVFPEGATVSFRAQCHRIVVCAKAGPPVRCGRTRSWENQLVKS